MRVRCDLGKSATHARREHLAVKLGRASHDPRETHRTRRVETERLVDARVEVRESLDVLVFQDTLDAAGSERRVELLLELLLGGRVLREVVHDGAARGAEKER